MCVCTCLCVCLCLCLCVEGYTAVTWGSKDQEERGSCQEIDGRDGVYGAVGTSDPPPKTYPASNMGPSVTI